MRFRLLAVCIVMAGYLVFAFSCNASEIPIESIGIQIITTESLDSDGNLRVETRELPVQGSEINDSDSDMVLVPSDSENQNMGEENPVLEQMPYQIITTESLDSDGNLRVETKELPVVQGSEIDDRDSDMLAVASDSENQSGDVSGGCNVGFVPGVVIFLGAVLKKNFKAK